MTAVARPPLPLSARALGLLPMRGEARNEVVYVGRYGPWSFWIKHEYPAAPWEWVILNGSYPMDVGTEPSEEEAASRLELSIRELCPAFFDPPPRGLLGKVARLIGL